MNFIIYFHPFLTRIKQIYAHKCILTKPFQLCANDFHFAQSIYLIDKTDKIPCLILEWSDTILELRNQVGIITLRRAILEWYRFPLCAEHIQPTHAFPYTSWEQRFSTDRTKTASAVEGHTRTICSIFKNLCSDRLH